MSCSPLCPSNNIIFCLLDDCALRPQSLRMGAGPVIEICAWHAGNPKINSRPKFQFSCFLYEWLIKRGITWCLPQSQTTDPPNSLREDHSSLVVQVPEQSPASPGETENITRLEPCRATANQYRQC